MADWDYIIIGSGSAGSALAYRLGEDGSKRILVLEFGGTDAGPFIQMPAALSYPMNMKTYDWGYRAEPEPAHETAPPSERPHWAWDAVGMGALCEPLQCVLLLFLGSDTLFENDAKSMGAGRSCRFVVPQ